MSECPLCHSDKAHKVIYLGLPMRLCHCACLFGFWAFVVDWLPVATDEGEFAFIVYRGSYGAALWRWLVG